MFLSPWTGAHCFYIIKMHYITVISRTACRFWTGERRKIEGHKISTKWRINQTIRAKIAELKTLEAKSCHFKQFVLCNHQRITSFSTSSSTHVNFFVVYFSREFRFIVDHNSKKNIGSSHHHSCLVALGNYFYQFIWNTFIMFHSWYIFFASQLHNNEYRSITTTCAFIIPDEPYNWLCEEDRLWRRALQIIVM